MPRKKGKAKSTKRTATPMFEGPGKRYYVSRLKWLIGFLNTDILNLPPGGFLNIFYDFLDFFYRPYVEETVLREICSDTDHDRRQLNEAQEFVESCLSTLLDKISWTEYYELFPEEKKGAKYEAFRDDVETTKVWLENDYQVPMAYHLVGERIRLAPEIKLYLYDNLQEDDIKEVHSFKTDRQMFVELGPGISLGKFSKFFDPNMHDTLRFGLFNLLEKFPLSSVKRCPGCNKYFLATTKKRSPFCARCIKKENVYTWREKNRPIYNTYQRNLQKGVKTPIKEIRAKLEQENKVKEE